ncbi:lysozyme g-like [Clupea harengus]|uniref:Lysozyme g n=1 Tax=Clupea harengus TaxID=7950 RepID=A0A6P8GDF8_CLUHA|nr:lysozyme g-like [Clupea harengus]
MSTYAQEAKEDLPHINKYKDKIIRAANNCNVQSSVVAGIISRETRGGRGAGLDSRGWSSGEENFGLMQVNRIHSPEGGWDSQEHIEQGCRILKGFNQHFDEKCPSWSAEQKLKGALAAYNKGTATMDYNNVDGHTDDKNYSADVLARAQVFQRNGY